MVDRASRFLMNDADQFPKEKSGGPPWPQNPFCASSMALTHLGTGPCTDHRQPSKHDEKFREACISGRDGKSGTSNRRLPQLGQPRGHPTGGAATSGGWGSSSEERRKMTRFSPGTASGHKTRSCQMKSKVQVSDVKSTSVLSAPSLPVSCPPLTTPPPIRPLSQSLAARLRAHGVTWWGSSIILSRGICISK